MCRPHWAKVPSDIKRRIGEFYRDGQCDDRKPSYEYLCAAKAAVVAVARQENITADTRLYDLMLAEFLADPRNA